jgi:hypothetical protein
MDGCQGENMTYGRRGRWNVDRGEVYFAKLLGHPSEKRRT